MNNDCMKSVNVMNFARQCEPRDEVVDKLLFETTAKQLRTLKKLGIPNTFLLQYDTLCDERFVKLFKEEADDNTEVGLWYEVVEPLTSACGMKYDSEYGWKWDWHIKPGFSMSYSPEERIVLIDEAMRKFKEVFGKYPEIVGSWLLDTVTACRLVDEYDVKGMCLCRDQTNTDAYSLVGGYFNGAYYPSRKNIFTPAQAPENSLGIPVFRLLGPSPLHDYDHEKFISKGLKGTNPGFWTLEPAWFAGEGNVFTNVMLDYFFGKETLNFAYAQIGQENSFADRDIVSPMVEQIECIKKMGDVEFEKMSDTAKNFNKRFKGVTPATVTCGLKNWDTEDIQSVYYQCKNYVANIFRDGPRVFIRAFFLFDDRVPEHYLNEKCDTFYALYENLPFVDTSVWAEGIRENIGLTLDTDGGELSFRKLSDSAVCVSWKDKEVVFDEEGIHTKGISKMTYDVKNSKADIKTEGGNVLYDYKGASYSLETNGEAYFKDNILTIKGKNGKNKDLIPKRGL